MENTGKSPKSEATIIWTLLLVTFLIMELSPFSVSHIALAQNSGTNVSGTITHDTTWTLTNSPYNFQGDVSVADGVTLTIEAGVTVDFTKDIQEIIGNSPPPVDTYYTYSLSVYGTLNALGSSSSPINFEDTTINVRIGGSTSYTINFYNDSQPP